MNRVDRSSLLLTLAGVLLLLAVGAYLISQAEDALRRKESALRTQETLRIQTERAIEERKIHATENHRTNQEWARLDSQQNAIIKSLKRIEAVLKMTDSTKADR